MRIEIRRAAALAAVSAMLMFVVSARADDKPKTSDDQPSSMLSVAVQLYGSLTDQQRSKAVLPFNSPERFAEVFTPGPRPGIPLRELSEQQRAMAKSLISKFTSDYGEKKCEAIVAQDHAGLERLYLAFFGEPGEGKTYAWRVAEHHLTIVHVDVEQGQVASVGPVLVGANPPTLWDAEEDAMIALYAALTPAERERASLPGKGISSRKLPENGGVRVGDLNPAAQEAVRAMYEGRLRFLSDDIRGRVNRVVDSAGGLGAMRIAFYGPADKRCAAGGRWDFKLGGPTFLCDYENSRGHIHMSMKGTVKAKDPK